MFRHTSIAVAVIALLSRGGEGAVSTFQKPFVDPGVPFAVQFVDEFSVQGQDMEFAVEAHYSNGISSANWDSGLEMASTGRFRLTQAGDTFSDTWSLTNLDPSYKLLKLVIRGAGNNGNTVFDLQGPTYLTTPGQVEPGKTDTSEQTAGSQKGSTFNWTNKDNFNDIIDLDEPSYNVYQSMDVIATYSNIVNLPLQSAKGDLWTTLTINFTGGMAGGLVSDIAFRFDADTDIFAPAEETPPVPEPSSLALMLGFGSLAACRFRRKR